MTIDTSRGANGSELEWGDYVSIAIYFIAVISVGLWVRMRYICQNHFNCNLCQINSTSLYNLMGYTGFIS